jgi:regulator of sirC expression with transglutaminase-like and TPR domain
MFYYENGGDLKKALEWIDAAIKETPQAYYFVYRKALIQAKMGDKAGALATAKASREAAQKDTQRELLRAEYTRLNDTLIASLK